MIQLIPLPPYRLLFQFKIQTRLTCLVLADVVLEKRPLNGCLSLMTLGHWCSDEEIKIVCRHEDKAEIGVTIYGFFDNFRQAIVVVCAKHVMKTFVVKMKYLHPTTTQQ